MAMTTAIPGGLIALGIIVGLLSTSVQSLGLTLQRKSHILEDEKGPQDVRRPPHRRRRWQLGMGMFVVANLIGSSVQIGTLPLPVLSTLQASGLVFNSICATLILGEPFTRWSLAGTLLVSSGAILIGIFGATPSPTHSLVELLDLFGRKPFIIWMSLQAVFIVALCVVTDVFSHVSTLSQSPRFRLARGLSYGCISGILSAHSLLMAKSAVELVIKTAVDGDNQFNKWQTYIIILALIVLALSQLYYLHRGLKLVSTSVLYPLVFCIYNIIAILDGLIYFRQTELITPLHAGLITLGTVILLAGVLALSWRLSDEQHQPAVGQSSLAPGLGLVEDTDGEEDEEELLLGGGRVGDEDDILPTAYKYSTFGSRNTSKIHSMPDSPSTPGRRSTSLSRLSKLDTPITNSHTPRYHEHIEIWDELDDDEDHEDETQHQDSPITPIFHPRHRARTMPTTATIPSPSLSPLLPQNESRRAISNGSALSLQSRLGRGNGHGNASTDQIPTNTDSSTLRKRRRSTGFPGFSARKHMRKSSGGLQDAVGGIWGLRWWNSRSVTTATTGTTSTTADIAGPVVLVDEEAGLLGNESRGGNGERDGDDEAEDENEEEQRRREHRARYRPPGDGDSAG